MADLIKLRQNPEHDYALRVTRDEAVLLAATLGAHSSHDHRVLRDSHATGGPRVVATGTDLYRVLHDAFDDTDDYHELSMAYDRHFDDAPRFPDVVLATASAAQPVDATPSPGDRVDVAVRHDVLRGRDIRVERVVHDADDPVTVYVDRTPYRWAAEHGAWVSMRETGVYLAYPRDAHDGDEPDPPAGYRVLRRTPRPGETVQPRWLEPAPSSGRRNVLAMPRDVHSVDPGIGAGQRVFVGPDRRDDDPYVWHADRQRFVLANGFDVDLLEAVPPPADRHDVDEPDPYVRPWHDVNIGDTVGVVFDHEVGDLRPTCFDVRDVERSGSAITGIRIGNDRHHYRLDGTCFVAPGASTVKLVWPDRVRAS